MPKPLIDFVGFATWWRHTRAMPSSTSHGSRRTTEEQWQASIVKFAAIPHVRFKISGLLMPIVGFGTEQRSTPMSTQEFVDRVGPLATWAIDTIGIDRCMFGSNFPMDKVSIDYASLVSAYDALLSNRSNEDKRMFFEEVARDFYRIGAD